jgi:hypothetical protein
MVRVPPVQSPAQLALFGVKTPKETPLPLGKETGEHVEESLQRKSASNDNGVRAAAASRRVREKQPGAESRRQRFHVDDGGSRGQQVFVTRLDDPSELARVRGLHIHGDVVDVVAALVADLAVADQMTGDVVTTEGKAKDDDESGTEADTTHPPRRIA